MSDNYTFYTLIEDPLLNILNVRRFSNLNLIKEDTDATHSYRIQILSIILFQDCDEVDLKKLIYKCCIHDLNEAGAGDIVSPIKHSTPEVNKAIEDAADKLLLSWGVSEKILKEARTSKDKSIEGKILSILDILDSLLTLYKEWKIQKSNILLDRVNDCQIYLEQKFDTLFPPDDSGVFHILHNIVNSTKTILT